MASQISQGVVIEGSPTSTLSRSLSLRLPTIQTHNTSTSRRYPLTMPSLPSRRQFSHSSHDAADHHTHYQLPQYLPAKQAAIPARSSRSIVLCFDGTGASRTQWTAFAASAPRNC